MYSAAMCSDSSRLALQGTEVQIFHKHKFEKCEKQLGTQTM
jgi:hypothetical protein